MTLDRLIGMTLAVGLPGTEATPQVLDALRRTRARSLVVFSRNFTSVAQWTRLRTTLRDALGEDLLILVDHEGGRVIRFCEGVTRFPDSLAIGRTHEADQVERQGRTEAQELRRLGVSVNLAPCVDVLEPGCDAVIGDRSYGSDPRRVSLLAAARIRGLQVAGVAACAKHYPGLGAVPRDPHKTLPTIRLDWAAMDQRHLPPFAAAIQAEVAMIMSSHVCYPDLGEPPDRPATFSPTLIREHLRQRLKFPGLILTDDLEMGALSAFGDMGEVAVRAAEAGHDLLLICSDLAAAQKAAAALHKSYQEGRLSRSDLDASAARFAIVLKKFGGTPLPV